MLLCLSVWPSFLLCLLGARHHPSFLWRQVGYKKIPTYPSRDLSGWTLGPGERNPTWELPSSLCLGLPIDTRTHSACPLLSGPDILQAASLGTSGKCTQLSLRGQVVSRAHHRTRVVYQEHVCNPESRRNVKIPCISCERRKR